MPAHSMVLAAQVAQFAAELERYSEAIEIYEGVARASVDNNLLKYSAKGYLLNAGICQLCSARPGVHINNCSWRVVPISLRLPRSRAPLGFRRVQRCRGRSTWHWRSGPHCYCKEIVLAVACIILHDLDVLWHMLCSVWCRFRAPQEEHPQLEGRRASLLGSMPNSFQE